MKLPPSLRAIGSALAERRAIRKRLRGPANLHYAIADSIDMLNPHTWASLAGNNGFFLSIPYLRMLEQVLPHNLRPRYALITQGPERQPVALLYMQIAEISLAQTRSVAPEEGAHTPLAQWAEHTRQRVLTCGNLLTYGQHGIAFAPDIDLALAWHGVAEVLYRVRQAEKLVAKLHFVMIKDLHAPLSDSARQLEQLSYRFVETEPNMVLELDPKWRSYDDYLASLAAKYRSSVRNAVFKPLDQAGCTLELLSDVGEHGPRLFELYKIVQSQADFRPFELRPEYFAALAAAAGGQLRCSVIKQHERILGFMITLADGPTALAYHIGFDRAAAGDLPIYLRLLHAGIADAIALGCQRVSFGRTALEPKAGLGAKPQNFGVLLRHRQPIINKLIKHLLLGIEHDDAPERNPFKKAATSGKASAEREGDGAAGKAAEQEPG
jgi:hypothetical protein